MAQGADRLGRLERTTTDDEPIVRLILDGTVVRVRLDKKATAISLLVVIGVREDGQKVLLAVKRMGGETTEAWRAVLDDLTSRGLRRPEFVIVDGGAGLDVRARGRVERRARAAVYGPLCRAPDYADQRGQTGLGGGDRCEGSGIIRAPPGRREVCRWGGIGRAKSRLASFWPRRAL